MLSGGRAVVALVIGLVTGAGLCLGVGSGVGQLVGDGVGGGPAVRPRATGEPTASAARESRAVATLRAWDARRAAAWARGDPAALRALYVPRSTAGAADVRLLRRWTARGLAVHDLREQVLAARVLELGPDRIRVVVTERLAGGSAGPPRGMRVRLPAGRTRTREVVLRRTGGDTGTWLVARVSVPLRAPP